MEAKIHEAYLSLALTPYLHFKPGIRGVSEDSSGCYTQRATYK